MVATVQTFSLLDHKNTKCYGFQRFANGAYQGWAFWPYKGSLQLLQHPIVIGSWIVLTENVHRASKNIIFVCFMLGCHVCTHVCFHLKLNVHIVRTFENRIPFQTFEKWHNVSYHYVSYIKSETCDIWRTGSWFLRPFIERVEENHIYHLVKSDSIVKNRTIYRGCNVCLQVLLVNGKIDFKSQIWNFNINFQTWIIICLTKPALKHRTEIISISWI